MRHCRRTQGMTVANKFLDFGQLPYENSYNLVDIDER